LATNPKSTPPDDNRKSFAIAHAASVAEQSARLLNVAYANLVNNINLSWQNAVSHQQEMLHLELVIVSGCVELILGTGPSSETAARQLEVSEQVMEMLSRTGKASADGQPTPATTAAAPPASKPAEASSQSPTFQNDRLPGDITAAMADSAGMSVGEQPAILANLALANQIANANLAQQYAIANQQAIFNLQMATFAKCVELIANISPPLATAIELPEAMRELLETMNRIQSANAAQVAPPQHSGTTPKDT
jgi:hypothetical protein